MDVQPKQERILDKNGPNRQSRSGSLFFVFTGTPAVSVALLGTAGIPSRKLYVPHNGRWYHWLHMSNDVYKTGRDCSECVQNESSEKCRRPPQLYPASGPLELFAMDILGPQSKTAKGIKFLLVMTDVLEVNKSVIDA